MYTSPDEARSDLLLAGAVFVFGPLIVALLLSIIPLMRFLPLAVVVTLILPVLFTALVPFLLVRYRGESWHAYGFSGDIGGGLIGGFLVGLPVVVAGVLGALVMGRSPAGAIPLIGVGPFQLLDTTIRVLTWVGLAILASYVTVKARDAFRSDFRTLPQSMAEIGRVLGIVVGIAAVLHLAFTRNLQSLLLPAGVAVAAWLVYRQLKGPSSTSRSTLLAPTVLLALGSFLLSFSAAQLVAGVWTGALIGGVGLVMGVLHEQRGSGWAVVGLALVIALLTPLPLPLRFGL